MPEVISLLSSPPPSPPKHPSPLRISNSNRLTTIHFGSDNFDTTGDLDFSIEQPSKKRKTSNQRPRPESKNVSNGYRAASLVVDLSSDIDLPALGPAVARANDAALDLPVQADEIDDIVFSSSAPARSTRETRDAFIVGEILDLSSDSLPDDPFEGLFNASQPPAPGHLRSVFTDRTINILANLSAKPPTSAMTKSKIRRQESEGRPASSVDVSVRMIGVGKELYDDIEASSPAKQRSRTDKATHAGGDAEQRSAAAKRAQQAVQKEAEKQRKQEDKVQKAREKQRAADLAEVNRSKTNKKDAIAEILVEMSRDIQGTSVGNQVEEYLKQADVPVSYFKQQLDLEENSLRFHDLGSVVQWKRKVAAVYDEDEGQWLPASNIRIKPEQHVLVYLRAIDFAMIAAGYSGQEKPNLPSEVKMKENFDLHVATIRSRHKDCIPIYLVESMNSWLRKNQNARNREYIAAVRAQQALDEGEEDPTGGGSSSQPKARKRKKPAAVDLSFITEDVTEDLLLHLQLAHQPILIQHTASASNTAAQIVSFTQHLSTRPYRQIEMKQNLKAASFCMATGQVRTGDNVQDTYIKMLQEVQRVTPAMAYGIAGEYPSVRELVKGFREKDNLMLEDVRKSANKDGAWTDRRLGPMVSKRLYKVFMGRDPAAMDGMS